jgi:hypothetical protein
MNDILEYLFFNRDFANQFTQAVDAKKIAWKEAVESVHQSILIQISEDDIGEYWDEIDDLYDEITIADQAQFELDPDVSTAGVYIQLKQGKQTIAHVNPDVLGRILAVISNDEFSEFIDIIAKSVETPDDAPICQRDG